ncbi:hypothetical protein [Actinomycetospora termitidis]|uniref:DUF4267 domain-containing protein n=1 Tax=Actinomycetospora termitidis TaxID=3053470 RepID=A0ABT7M7L1_9PSEU|nr:hypothetical protein [Actinomycetospora sp. Odt1-22]MDL5156654.1 hypothetical protein [Actinomycetospora sp. Odt1-22]
MTLTSSSSKAPWLARVLGVATAAYSVAIIAKPELFARPTKLARDGDELSRGTTIGIRALGGRDLACGLAMALAPEGQPLRTATAVRVGSDVVDLVLLGTSLPDREARTKSVAVAGGWGALCALGWWLA